MHADADGNAVFTSAKSLRLNLPSFKDQDTGRIGVSRPTAANLQHSLTAVSSVPSTLMVDGVVGGGEIDVYGLNLTAGQTYTFSLRGTGAQALTDPFLYVFDQSESLLVFDDDGGDGINSLITYTATYTGVHYVGAAAYPESGDTGSYTLDAVLLPSTDTVGDTFEEAKSLAVNGVTFGSIEAGVPPVYSGLGDVDTFKIQVEAGKLYTIELAGGADYNSDPFDLPPGELDTVLIVYDSAGNTVAVNDDVSFPSDISSKVSFFAAESGTYYVDASAYAGQTGGYTITSTAVDLSSANPLDAIDWKNAADVPFVSVNGTPTAYVYFGDSDENFGQTADDGVSPLITFDWNDYEKGQVMQALEEYEKILGTNYEITTDINQATFRLLKAESEDYGAYFIPQDPSYGSDQGVGVFNILSGGWSFDQQQSLEKGGYSFAVILHEFGHAHGLAHPHDTGGGSDVMLGVTSATGSYGLFNLNQGVYTVMSYNDAWDFHPDGPTPYTGAGVDNGWSGSLSAFDIAQLQVRYGVHDYATGNNVYELTDIVDDAFYQTIWDTAGTDEIRYTGTLNATIDLLAATLDYSPTGGGVLSYLNGPADSGLRGGYTIANGVIVENATGGSGTDALLGNDAANRLTGNAGDDTFLGRGGDDIISGGVGTDTAIYSGNRSEYAVLRESDGTFKIVDRVSGRDGDDQTTSIENWQFADGTLTTAQLDATNIVRGTAGNDDVHASSGYDGYVSTGAGDDILRGRGKDDMLIGGSGNDQLWGGGGADQFRFFGNDIEGPKDRDRIYDLTLGEGDQLVFGSFGSGTFTDSAHVNAYTNGTSATISTLLGLYEADMASDLITVTRQGNNNNLLFSVTNGSGQVQEVLISNVWSQYVQASGTMQAPAFMV
jgi:Ca2+-binding RTX toxin-like protein